jgi:oligoribonuclease
MKLMWIDLEMSGLEIETNVIIEVACIITNEKLEEIETYHAIVQQPQKYLDQMDEWNKKTHKESGLLDKIPQGKPPQEVEKELVSLGKKHFGSERIILAGNSVGHDRAFLNHYFKDFSKMLHYRLLDVSSWKIIFKDVLNFKFDKKNTHRALDDIRESIGELKYYMGFIKKD